MILHHLLKLTLVLISILGIVLLMLGRQDNTLPMLAILAAMLSFVVTDLFGLIRLNRPMANFSALLAIALSLFEFFQNQNSSAISQGSQLIAITNLLIYLQVILLYQEKANRVCWQILTLSLLQVLVSAALNDSIFYGLLLMVYISLGIVALWLMASYDSLIAYSLQAEQDDDPDNWQTAATSRKHRSTFSNLIGCQSTLPPTKTYLRFLFGGAIKMMCLTVLLATVSFVLFPRGAGRPLLKLPPSHSSSIGYSDHVALSSDADFIREQSEVVFELRLFDAISDQPYQVTGDLWLKGKTVLNYHQGIWTTKRSANPEVSKINIHSTKRDIVRQTINYYDNKSKSCRVKPLVNLPGNYPKNGSRLESGAYTFTTIGFYDNRQHQLTPTNSKSRLIEQELLQLPGSTDTADQNPSDSKSPVPRLVKKYVEDLFHRKQAEDFSVYDKITLLHDHLKYSGKFTYTLNLPQRDPKLDPVDDFLINHPIGHCSYFASALAVMCRTQGIPCRLAIGYRTTAKDHLDNFYQVKALNAHTWVEVYLEKKQIPDELKIPNEKYDHGAWLRVDPTPGLAVDSLAAETGMLAEFRKQMDRANLLWRHYVVNFNNRTQDEHIYKPLIAKSAEILQDISYNNWLADSFNRFSNLFGLSIESRFQQWLSWQGMLLVATLLVCFLAVLYWGYRLLRLTGQLRLRFRQRQKKIARIRDSGFYGEFEVMLESQGMSRCPGQTPYEFCLTVSGQLAENQNLKRVASIPKKIVSFFYRVRFGNRPLDESEQHEVAQALQQLQTAFKSCNSI